MEKVKKSRIEIPKYTLGEELVSAISHGIGAVFGVVGLVLCLIKAVSTNDALRITCAAVYGSTLIVLYAMSTMYHSLKVNRAKKVFRVIDHCSIYLLIAGTYTPYSLITLQGWVGYAIFAAVWITAIVGIVFSAIDLKKFRAFAMTAYIAMGWVIILAIKPLIDSLATAGLWLLFIGGVAYTLGVLPFALGKKHKYMHSMFHFFVLAGSILHFLSIYLYVL
ncbi:MAG: hemolysin III family protein [Clostridia bacterium]|nr:hemolysin III family protein [Clostridia bacterium]